MALFSMVHLLTMVLIGGVSSTPFNSSQLPSVRISPAPDLSQLKASKANDLLHLEVKKVHGTTETNQREFVVNNRHAATKDHDLTLRDTPLARRQRPGEILAEIARVMQNPFHDMFSFAISSGVTVSILFYIGKFIKAIANIYTHQPPQSRFDLKVGPMKASFYRPSEPIPWNSVGNIFRNLARNVDRGYIGLSKFMLHRDDIEIGADVTAEEQAIFFALTMGTVLLLLYGLPEDRANFVG